MIPTEPPSWSTYFATDDAAATCARITQTGGSVDAEPMDVGPLGRMAFGRDPQGNRFGLWQAGEHTGAQVFNEPGSLVWNEAAVEDPTAAQEFYSAVFGFTFTPIEGMGGYSTFATADRPLGGLRSITPGAPKGWSVCFSVRSTDEAVATVEKSSRKVTMAAQDTSLGRFAVVEDRWGAGFSVMQELPG